MSRRRSDPLAALIRAVRGCTDVELTVEQADSDGWASATFVGATHRLVISLSGEGSDEGADALAGLLATHEFALHGHIVADVVTRRCDSPDGRVRLGIDILTIEE